MTDCLVVIDVQRGFESRTEERSNPTAEANIARLLDATGRAHVNSGPTPSLTRAALSG